MTLTPRQLEIARLVADDLADKEIASILQISERTVQEHLDRMGQKLGQQGIARRRAIARWVEENERDHPHTDAA